VMSLKIITMKVGLILTVFSDLAVIDNGRNCEDGSVRDF